MGESNSIGFPRQLKEADLFYRAIQCVYLKPNGRISPGAFSNTSKKNEMSADWAERSTPEETIARFPKWKGRKGVASVSAKIFWDKEKVIRYDPLPDNDAHTAIVGDDPDRVRKYLARNAKLIYETCAC